MLSHLRLSTFLKTITPVVFSASTRLASSHVAVRDDDKRILTVTWDNSKRTVHPFTWLMDRCRCPKCAHPQVVGQLMSLQNLDLSCQPDSISFNDEESEMNIKWKSGHASSYPYEWLIDHCFVSPKKEAPLSKKAWGRDHIAKQLEWADILEDEKVLYDFLYTVKVDGVAVVTGAPKNETALENLIDRIGYPKSNHYGLYFDVISKKTPESVAYTPNYLSHHIDLPYFEVPPGVQFLHCMMRTPDVVGGTNTIADGIFAGEILRRDDPEAFEILSNTDVHFWNLLSLPGGSNFHYEYSQKTLNLDAEGNIYRVIFSTIFQSAKPCVSAENADAFYRALKAFESLIIQESITHDAREGEILVVDNHRVLHSRTAYEITGDGMRQLKGGYVDWDAFNSRLRRCHANLQSAKKL